MKKIILFLILLIFIIGCVKEIGKPTENTEQQLPEIQEEGTIEETPEETVQEGSKESEKIEIQEETQIPVGEKETQTNWLTFHGDSARTGFSLSKAPSKPNVLWKWTFDDFVKIPFAALRSPKFARLAL